MAKRQSKDSLIKTLRASGMRKKAARATADAAAGHRKSEARLARHTATRLHEAADRLEEQIRGTNRTEAGKKAARTHKRHAAERSAAARKSARTRSAKRA